MAILTIFHVMKSSGYECQNHKIRVLRQSLQISAIESMYQVPEISEIP